MVGLDAQRFCKLGEHVVRRHRAVAMDDVVEVPRREACFLRQRTISDSGLCHQSLDRRTERLGGVRRGGLLGCHQLPFRWVNRTVIE